MNKKDLKRKSQLVKLLSKQEAKNPSNSINKHEEIIKPILPQKTGKLESIKPKPVPQKGVNKDIILPPPKDDFNFNNDIFQTENQSHEKFKIISIQSRENKKIQKPHK